jgi:hypothetical protein
MPRGPPPALPDPQPLVVRPGGGIRPHPRPDDTYCCLYHWLVQMLLIDHCTVHALFSPFTLIHASITIGFAAAFRPV